MCRGIGGRAEASSQSVLRHGLGSAILAPVTKVSQALFEQAFADPSPVHHRQRTVKNVLHSDGTAILFNQSLSGGTLYTHDVCRRERKPYIMLDATQISVSAAAAAIVGFIKEHDIKVLNVAGPRLSRWAEGYGFALRVMGEVILGSSRSRSGPA